MNECKKSMFSHNNLFFHKNYFIYKVDVDVVDDDSLLTSGALSLKGHSKI